MKEKRDGVGLLVGVEWEAGDLVQVTVDEGCILRASHGYAAPHLGPASGKGRVVRVGQNFFEGHPYTVEFPELRPNSYGYWPKGDYAEAELELLEGGLVENHERMLYDGLSPCPVEHFLEDDDDR